jgi:hypothetical protein
VFPVELPTGTTMQNLVAAIGDGFRRPVCASESGRITGHARLVPTGPGGGAAGAAIVLGR